MYLDEALKQVNEDLSSSGINLFDYIIAYADDLVIHAPANILQRVYNSIVSGFSHYGFFINERKSATFRYFISGTQIPYVSEYKYLGVLVRPARRSQGGVVVVSDTLMKANF